MHLGGGGNTVAELFHGVTPVFCPKKFSVPLHLIAYDGGGRQAHLIHPDGVKVGAELITVQLYIDEPVVIVFGEEARVVDQIVGGQVILA